MKKILLFAAAAVLTATAASAQFKMGAKVGANMSNLSNIKFDDTKVQSRFGLTAGVFAEYALSEKFALSADVLYSQQGNVLKAKEGNDKMTNKYDYLNIPVLANYYVFDGFAVKAGLQPGMLLSAKSKYTGSTDGEYDGTTDLKKEKAVETFDLAIPVGVSYELPMGLQFDARYALGMLKTNKIKDDGEKDSKNGVFSLTVGYKF